MNRTILFFGASNTRGYGVDAEQRFAALLERELRTELRDSWEFAVVSSPPGFARFRDKLEAAMQRSPPAVLVVQSPTHPLSFEINFPRWLNALRRLQARHLAWRQERAVRAEIHGDPAGTRSRREVLSQGRFIESVYRYRLGSLPVLRRLRTYAARRYGLVTKATLDEYLAGVLSLWRIARTHMQGRIIVIGILPLGEDGFPGYSERAREWNRALGAALNDTTLNCSFVDVLQPLSQIPSDQFLLSDDTHLSATGHRELAMLLLPELRRVMQEAEAQGSVQGQRR